MLITTQDRRSVVTYIEPEASALTVTHNKESGKYDLALVTNRTTVFLLGTFAAVKVAIDVMNDIIGDYLGDVDEYRIPADPGELPC